MADTLRKIVYCSQDQYNEMKASGTLDENSLYMTPSSGSDSSGGSTGGGGTSGGSAVVAVDDLTIVQNDDGTITTVAIKTQDGTVQAHWVGTLEEWQAGRDAGTIDDDWLCFITDDGDPVTSSSSYKLYASVEYVDAIIRQKVDPLSADFSEFKTNMNSAISSLQETDNSFNSRITALEVAFGNLLDDINGEVI